MIKLKFFVPEIGNEDVRTTVKTFCMHARGTTLQVRKVAERREYIDAVVSAEGRFVPA